MERSTGPRIYVPINVPDHTSQPTYAVLEFVGFSTPTPSTAGSSHHLLHAPATVATPPPSLPPAVLCLPPPASSSPPPAAAAAPASSFYPLPPATAGAQRAIISGPPLLPISHFLADAATFLVPSPAHLLPPSAAHHQQYYHRHLPSLPYPGARLDVVNLDSPPSSPSSLAPSSASSASRESSKEKHPTSSAPVLAAQTPSSINLPPGVLPIVCFSPSLSDASSALVNGSSSRPAVTFSSPHPEGAHSCSVSLPRPTFSQMPERDVMQTKISISQTDRETVVHTHSSNFRDVVRKLTGASSDDQDLLPVTLPARLASRVNSANMGQSQVASPEVSASGAAAGGAGAHGGLSGREQLGLRRAPLKLHERRKSTMKNLEKVTSVFSLHGAAESSPIMNPSPVTPLASDFERCCNASTPTSQGSSAMSSPIAYFGKGKATTEGGVAREQSQQEEIGCFFSLQRPLASARPPASPLEKPSPPTLLSLFPESPACSPHGR